MSSNISRRDLLAGVAAGAAVVATATAIPKNLFAKDSKSTIKMYDLHTHTIHSDGTVTPSESAMSALAAGYSGIAVTDHADYSNLENILEANLKFKEMYNKSSENFKVIVGVELTHIHPNDIEAFTKFAKSRGADIVVMHGETVVEPVPKGTNLAAIEAQVDVLAHPGLITKDEAILAKKNGVYLEITTRNGHSYTNGHVFRMAKDSGAKLVINNDTHSPSQYISKEKTTKVLAGCDMVESEIIEVFKNNEDLFMNKLMRV